MDQQRVPESKAISSARARAAGTLLLAAIFGLLFIGGAVQLLFDKYCCTPDTGSQLKYISGTLLEAQKSHKRGGSFVVWADGDTNRFNVANTIADELKPFLGQPIRIGVVQGFLCREAVMHIESQQGIILNFKVVRENIKNGATYDVLAAVLLALAALVLLNGYGRAKEIRRRWRRAGQHLLPGQ